MQNIKGGAFRKQDFVIPCRVVRSGWPIALCRSLFDVVYDRFDGLGRFQK